MIDQSWHNAHLALRLLAIDPLGLGGAVVRMRACPDRDRLLSTFASPLPMRKLPINISDEQLFGGLDLTATLRAGHAVQTRPFFEQSSIAMISMAERCPMDLAAKLSQLMDQSATSGFLIIDEGIENDEKPPDGLTDRCAFHIEPVGRAPQEFGKDNRSLPQGTMTVEDAVTQLTVLAARFGIASLRAPMLALRTAKAHASLMGRSMLSVADVEVAAALVYPHRATVLPDDAPDQEPPEPSAQSPEPQGSDGSADDLPLNTDMLINAVKAVLPPDLLNGLASSKTSKASSGAGAGQKRSSNRRGRPLPSRAGRLDGTSRIDLIATLRAAAPWQPLRRKQTPDRAGLLIRSADIRLKRYAEHSDRLLIFTVDASGSAAMSRLGEAKGAIELLLADAYAKRDHVALISFRGHQAETLLPPTRSLVQTKRNLSALPGGGGTPLASGLQHALLMGQQAKSKGLTPTTILITDGRANIALDGSANRAQAGSDATAMAAALRASGAASLVIDMSKRPHAALRDLGQTLDAPYVPLPRADAKQLSGTVNALLEA